MDNINSENKNNMELLKSDNPALRREIIESLISEELSKEEVKQLCTMLIDPDKGVRDSASFTLIYNGNPLIPKYVVSYVSSADIAIRNLAGEVLLKIGENSISDMVEYVRSSTNDDDIKFIIDIMGLIGNEKPVPDIFHLLENNKNDNVLLACFEALGNIGYAEALPVLIKFYEQNELYKPTIIEAMGKMNSKEILEFVLSRYSIEDELTKFSIIESLGSLGDENTFFFLLSELTRIKGPLVWVILSSLQSLKEKFSLDLPFDENIKNSILYTLLEAEPKFKRAAAAIVTDYEDKDILDALLKIYGEDAEIDENIKSALYQSPVVIMTKISTVIKQKPKNLKHLLWLVKEIIDFDGGETLNNLSELDKHNLCDSFSVCLDHSDEEIRKSSAELLFVVSIDTALLFVDSIIEDNDMWNRLKVLELIENIFLPKTNEVLKKLANDPEEMVSERAAWILAQRGITDFQIKVSNE